METADILLEIAEVTSPVIGLCRASLSRFPAGFACYQAIEANSEASI